MIRPVDPADSDAIRSIYNYYVENTHACFEETAVPAADMEERIRKISEKFPYLVWEEETNRHEIAGYIYANTWKDRSAYRFSAELSMYVKDGFLDRGIGRKLMEGMLEDIRKAGIHSLVSGIVLPNDRCIALHEKFGFKKIAQFEEIGFKFNRWYDVGYWELKLN